jgi:hypothetical protein
MQVYDRESTQELRVAALENNATEGDGWEPLNKGYPEMTPTAKA